LVSAGLAEVLLPQMGKARGPKTPRTHKSAMDTGTRLPDHPALARDFGRGYERVKDTRQQPQKAKGLSPTGGMELRNFHTNDTRRGGAGRPPRHSPPGTSSTQRNNTVCGVVAVRCDVRTLVRIEKGPGALQVPSWRFVSGRNRQPRAQGAPARLHVQKNVRRNKAGDVVLIRRRFLRALPAPTPHLPPPACISTCATNTGKLH
jgi:hypothetical protein